MKHRLARIATTTALAGALLLVLAGVAASIFNERAYQARRAQALTAQAQVLARTVAPALVFDDPAAAAELVGALEGNDQIASAAIYDARGVRIATFARTVDAAPRGAAARTEPHALTVSAPVVHEGAAIGLVSLSVVHEPLSGVVTRHAGVALLLLMALLLVGAAQAAARVQAGAARESRARAAELTALNAELQEQIERRETAEAALRQAQKMETLGQLTGGIAHDFNNLLQSVQGSFDMIVRHPEDIQRVSRWGRAGLEAAERGSRLTAQLLAFSRSQKLEMRPVDVREMMERLRALVPSALGAGVRVSLAAPDPLWVVGDATQLELAILNLCINSRDAMPDGGDIRIAATEEDVTDDPELSSGRYVRLTVSDTGVGMPADVQSHAFEPFYTTKGLGKGTGLGLAQVYGIAREAGGAARIESAAGVGTTVSLYLPRADPDALGAARTVAGGADPQAAAGARILIIDDDAGVRAYVCDALTSLGYGCIQAADGPEGLTLLDREAIDLLLVDYAMPGMNGAEVAARALARRPDLPVLFASGYAETHALEAALGRPAEMIRKPFDTAALAARISELLSRPPRG